MKYVAKIKRSILLNSQVNVVKSWVSPKIKTGYKYLTSAQYNKLLSLGFHPIRLTTPIEKPQKKEITTKSVVVIWEDEEGSHETNFDSATEAHKWISFQESLAESGEKFNLIEIK